MGKKIAVVIVAFIAIVGLIVTGVFVLKNRKEKVGSEEADDTREEYGVKNEENAASDGAIGTQPENFDDLDVDQGFGTAEDGQVAFEQEMADADKRKVTEYPDVTFISGYLLPGDYGEEVADESELPEGIERYEELALRLSIPYIQSAIIMDFQGIELWNEVSAQWKSNTQRKYDAYWLNKWNVYNLTDAAVADAESYLERFAVVPQYIDEKQYSFRIVENGDFVSMVTFLFSEDGELSQYSEQLLFGYVQELPAGIAGPIAEGQKPGNEGEQDFGGDTIAEKPESNGDIQVQDPDWEAAQEEGDRGAVVVGDLAYMPSGSRKSYVMLDGIHDFVMSVTTKVYQDLLVTVSKTVYDDYPDFDGILTAEDYKFNGENYWEFYLAALEDDVLRYLVKVERRDDNTYEIEVSREGD